MNAVVFEHVPVADLPEKWRAMLTKASDALVTVRIDEETPTLPPADFTSDDPAFGIWRDRTDINDTSAYARKLREPRYDRSGSRRQR